MWRRRVGPSAPNTFVHRVGVGNHRHIIANEWGLFRIVVYPQPYVVYPYEIRDIGNVVDKAIKGWASRVVNETGKSNNADKTTRIRNGSYNLVAYIAPRRMNGERIAMRYNDWSYACIDRVERRLLTGVRTIDNYTLFVQAPDQINAEIAETAIGPLIRAITHPVFHIIAKLDDANAERLIERNKIEIIFNRIGTLKVQQNRKLSLLFRFRNVPRFVNLHQTRVLHK